MSVKIEKRDVKVNICDLCHREVASLSKCVICKRDMCHGGMDQHTSHSLEVFSHRLDNKICSAYVCKECATKKTDLTIGQLLDAMFGESPVQVIYTSDYARYDYLLGVLVDLQIVTAEQADQARKDAKPDQNALGVLLEKKLITSAQIAQAKAAQFGTEVAYLRKFAIVDPEVIAAIPESIARKYRVIPIEKSSGCVSIAIADPSDLNTIDSLTHLLNAEIKLYVASDEDIAAALDKYYPEKPPMSPLPDDTCPRCGHVMVRNGAFAKCMNCGESKGPA